MIQSAENIDRDRVLHSDVCIIGAGAAGISIAQELSSSSLDVIVLESGGRESDRPTQDLYRGETLGAPQFPLDESRLRFLGGSTNHWAGMCRPLDTLDFEARSWVSDSGWPISREDLEPYYSRAHPVCDLGPYNYDQAAWDASIDPGEAFARHEIVPKLIQFSRPTRFGSKYRRLLKQSQSLRVFLHANVEEIVPDSSARTVERLQVRTLGGNRFSVSSRACVLACGGIENPRILLLSNGVRPNGLGNENDLVGRYFMDHPAVKPFGILVFSDKRWQRLAKISRKKNIRIRNGYGLTPGVQQRERLLNNVFYIWSPVPIEKIAEFDDSDEDTARFVAGLGGHTGPLSAARCHIRSEQAPNPASRVTLSGELDSLGQRRATLDWQFLDINRDTFQRSARTYADRIARSGVGRVKVVPWLLEESSGASWVQRVEAGNHHIGTTRMADTPSRGVVDADCKVFGIDNLWIAGSSVFPTSGCVNPTLTIVALALRLSDHLKSVLR